MPRKYAKSARKVSRTKRTYRRRTGYRRTGYKTLSRRISAISRRVAGEVCKFEITPDLFSNYRLEQSGSTILPHAQQPLLNIDSGNPWIMPLNWFYTGSFKNDGDIDETWSTQNGLYIDGGLIPNAQIPDSQEISIRNPIFYNTVSLNNDGPSITNAPIVEVNESQNINSTEYQYRLKYLYINALFNAEDSTDGALRLVIVKDKQPTGGSATWYDSDNVNTSRGVFNAERIDAQLNPRTVGRYKIMYDKTLRFTTINSYKPFKYFKAISSVVRNNRELVSNSSVSNSSLPTNQSSDYQTNQKAPPVQKNAYYLMIFSDGLNFTFTDQNTTDAGEFHLFNRVAYYNN